MAFLRLMLVMATMPCCISAFQMAKPFALRASRMSISRPCAAELAMSSQPTTRREAMLAAAGLTLGTLLPLPTWADQGSRATFHIKTAEGVEGDVVFQLFPELAPKTVEAFTKYAKEGLYDGTAFHRVATFLDKAVLIGGDPFTKEQPYCYKDIKDAEICSEGEGYGPDGFFSSPKRQSKDDNKKTRQTWDKGGPSYWRKDSLSKVKLEPEFGKLPHERGVITMRRFGAPDSAGSQFIICLSDMTKELDGNYAAFGKVVEGIEILDKMKQVDTFKSVSALSFPRDDKKPEAVFGAWDVPVSRQGIEKVTIE
mmetsp:Transcript_3222/g.7769  ORF Transcript_3222/g.7769 Transcript_3222/m.7769 type:complete len:311 (-) Transcript_3222:77-1009(-)